MGKKKGLLVTERAKIAPLNEGYSERQISKKLKFSKTVFYLAISKFWEFSGLAQVWKTQGYLPKG